MKGMIVVDVDRCLSCKTCELACAVEHSKTKDIYAAADEQPPAAGRVKVEAVEDFGVPLQCRQCEDAPCVKVCPSGALNRNSQEEPVLIENGLCIGCKMCIVVCPFGVIRMDKAGKAILKCDMCFERLKEGKLPACVAACPTKAMKFKTEQEVASQKRKKYLTLIAKGGREF